MTDLFEQTDKGNSELNPEEKEGLIPSYIALRRELNEAEQENILEAESWAFDRKRNILDERFLQNLHKRMYGNVWQWAGTYRTTGKNIGVDTYRIAVDLRELLDNCRYWIENDTYAPDEIAARFHHKLVFIHCYPNGNGRHARLATDLLIKSLGCERFSWGSRSLVDSSEVRNKYIAALQAADRNDYELLREFVRS